MEKAESLIGYTLLAGIFAFFAYHLWPNPWAVLPALVICSILIMAVIANREYRMKARMREMTDSVDSENRRDLPEFYRELVSNGVITFEKGVTFFNNDKLEKRIRNLRLILKMIIPLCLISGAFLIYYNPSPAEKAFYDASLITLIAASLVLLLATFPVHRNDQEVIRGIIVNKKIEKNKEYDEFVFYLAEENKVSVPNILYDQFFIGDLVEIRQLDNDYPYYTKVKLLARFPYSQERASMVMGREKIVAAEIFAS